MTVVSFYIQSGFFFCSQILQIGVSPDLRDDYGLLMRTSTRMVGRKKTNLVNTKEPCHDPALTEVTKRIHRPVPITP